MQIWNVERVHPQEVNLGVIITWMVCKANGLERTTKEGSIDGEGQGRLQESKPASDKGRRELTSSECSGSGTSYTVLQHTDHNPGGLKLLLS